MLKFVDKYWCKSDPPDKICDKKPKKIITDTLSCKKYKKPGFHHPWFPFRPFKFEWYCSIRCTGKYKIDLECNLIGKPPK